MKMTSKCYCFLLTTFYHILIKPFYTYKEVMPFSGKNHIGIKIALINSSIKKVFNFKYVGQSLMYHDDYEEVESKISLSQSLYRCIIKYLKRKTRNEMQLKYYNEAHTLSIIW